MGSDRHSRAQDLFEKAEALPPGDREEFLRSACTDDPTLQLEITELLEAAEGMPDDFLEPPLTVRPERIRVGNRLAHYRILEPLGAGGMGEVYLAEDERLKRRVALKILPPELASNQERLQRFQREAETVAALNHPNIVTIYSIENESGLRFLTMELIDGPSLRQLLDHSGALPLDDVLHLGIQISEGLAEAHGAGIVHRDLKPGNVMVAPNDRVKVLDFGLARPDQPLGTDTKRRLTRDGAILGTVAYMSPEQLTGQRVDSRSDVFSLGILLFELATGSHPFPAETETSVLARILEREPEKLLEARPGLPAELQRIIGRCLEKNPNKRYQDTAQVVRELRGLRRTTDRASRSEEPWPVGRRSSLFARPGLLAAATSLVLILAVLGIWRWTPPEKSRRLGEETLSIAVLPLRNISQDPEESDYLAAGIGQAVTTKLTQTGLRVAPWESVLRAHRDQPLDEVAAELGVAALLVGTFQLADERIRTTLSLVETANGFQAWAQDFDEPFEDLFSIQNQIALAVAQSIKGGVTPEEQENLVTPPSDSLDAYDFYLQGAHLLQAEDEASVAVASQYFGRALDLDPGLVEAHIGLGAAHSMREFNNWGGLEDLRIAEKHYLDALRLEPTSMRARRGLMRVEAERGRSEEILIHAREARRAGRPGDVEGLLAEADGYAMGGLPELALPIFREILAIDPLNQEAAWWLVLLPAWIGDSEAALSAGQEYLTKFGDDGMIHTWVGNSYYWQGQRDKAEAHYEKAMTGPTGSASLTSRVFRGHLQQEEGRSEEANATWAIGLEAVRSRKVEVPDHPKLQGLEATFETCLDGARPGHEWLDMMDQNPPAGVDFGLVAAALASQDDWQRSVEVLNWMFDSGNLFPVWPGYLRGLGVDPDAPQLESIRQKYDTRTRALKERFGPDDPDERVSAR